MDITADVTHRKCKTCHLIKPLSAFSKKLDGHQPDCKSCCAIKHKAWRASKRVDWDPDRLAAWEWRRKNSELKDSKICSICDQELPLSYFPKREVGSRDKCRRTCISCRDQYMRDYRENHNDEAKTKAKQKYLENRGRILRDKKIDYHKNPEKYLRIDKKYRDVHRDEINQRRVKRCQTDPDFRMKLAYRSRRRNELKRMLDNHYSLGDEKVTRTAFGNRCFRCLSDTNLEIDHHYPLSRGFGLSLDNAVVLCESCNSSKNNRWPHEFYSTDELYRLEYLLGLISVTNGGY